MLQFGGVWGIHAPAAMGIKRCVELRQSTGMGGAAVPLLTLWSCVIVLLALAARSAARLLSDRAPADPTAPTCSLTSRVGDGLHLTMAGGMVAMVAPLGLPPIALIAFFSATTAFSAGTWLRRVLLRRLAVSRGGVASCRPAHALEPHHLIIGLAMIAMAARMDDPGLGSFGSGFGTGPGAGASSMAGMSGMAGMAASGSWLGLGTLSLIYVWAAVLVLGWGLVKTVTTRPVPNDAVAILAAPVTVYACELAMTVVMGLMLL